MKKVFAIVLAALLVASIPAFSQEIRASKIPAATATGITIPANVPGGTAADDSATTSTTKYVELLLMTTEMPVSFVRMEAGDSGLTVNGQMSVGASYVLMYGKGELQSDNSVKNFRSYVFGGPVVSLDTVTGSSVYTGVTIGGVVGINPVSAIIGYDLLSKKMVIGLGLKIDLLTITDATTVVVKRWDSK